MSIKMPRFRGGVFRVLGGGGKSRFYFYGREDFSDFLAVVGRLLVANPLSPTPFRILTSRLSFRATGPPDPELIFKPREA